MKQNETDFISNWAKNEIEIFWHCPWIHKSETIIFCMYFSLKKLSILNKNLAFTGQTPPLLWNSDKAGEVKCGQDF